MDVVSLGYRTDLALLQLAGSTVEDRGDHLVVRTPTNPTYWWGNFLLLQEAPTLAESARWLDRFAEAFPDAGHLAFGVDGTEGRVSDLVGFSKAGCTVEAQAVMTASEVRERARTHPRAVQRRLVSEADWEQSLELRLRCHESGAAADVRRFLSGRVAANRGLVERGHGAWFGAFVDDSLVAQLGLVRVDGGLARFQSVETDPAHRRRGLAGGLVHAASRYGFDELGARTLVMVADPDYHAIDLYRSVGFTVTEVQLQAERAPVEPRGDRA